MDIEDGEGGASVSVGDLHFEGRAVLEDGVYELGVLFHLAADFGEVAEGLVRSVFVCWGCRDTNLIGPVLACSDSSSIWHTV